MCGLFGWCGNSPDKFSWDKFNVLGLYNDTRGGDSCGRTFGTSVLKGIGKESDYEELVMKYRNGDMNANSILGHTRKASVGGKTLAAAQPIIINDKVGNTNEPVFQLIHNGTISNYGELANSYGIDPIGKTDSQVLAEIIYNNGYDCGVLSDYIGAAAIVFKYSDDPETIYVFKGSSKMFETSKTDSEERPLFYYQESKDSLYFSSIENSLIFIGGENGGDDPDVEEFDCNTLYSITNGVLNKIITIDRSESYQKESNYKSYNNYGSVHGSVYNKTMSLPQSASSKITKLEEEVAIWPDRSDEIYYCKGRYWINKEFANGIYYIDRDGFVSSTKKPGYDIYYFTRGIMIKGHTEFQDASRMSKELYTEDYNFSNKIRLCSKYPFQLWGVQYGSMKDTSEGNSFFYTGSFKPLWSHKEYEFENGDLTKIKHTSSINIPHSTIVTNNNSNEKSDLPFDADTEESIAKIQCPTCKGSGITEDGRSKWLCSTCDGEGFIPIDDSDDDVLADIIAREDIIEILNRLDSYITMAKGQIENIGKSNELVKKALDVIERTQEIIDEELDLSK